ncbi:hypothetical protein AGDE_13791 [Angomonas deanei]|uniref:Uncharacterized protein n=1 Tax=Angomonas deanei TaxID=59799 RepID=A0A7G2CV61_9TRYP|nr:hypothetical protein AGDE_13791 [Angomonas deanei]CAD2222814.1 hypothetical protein, conserved [Angomonas deanei]|eukprot:EPY21779.1 hypothetical protein AGDE_13791 [Angomonas deanei]
MFPGHRTPAPLSGAFGDFLSFYITIFIYALCFGAYFIFRCVPHVSPFFFFYPFANVVFTHSSFFFFSNLKPSFPTLLLHFHAQRERKVFCASDATSGNGPISV